MSSPGVHLEPGREALGDFMKCHWNAVSVRLEPGREALGDFMKCHWIAVSVVHMEKKIATAAQQQFLLLRM